MDEIVEVSQKVIFQRNKHKGFQLDIKKSPRIRDRSQDQEKLDEILQDSGESNHINNVNQKELFQDIEKDIEQLQNALDNPPNQKIEKSKSIEKQIPWKLDASNQLSPKNCLTIEQNITSGDGLFKDASENRQIIKTEKDEMTTSQIISNDVTNQLQSPQYKVMSPCFSKQGESTLRRHRNSQLAVIERLRERQKDVKNMQIMPEFQSTLLKKIKLKKNLLRQGTQTDKQGNGLYSFMSHIKQINILKRFQNKMKSTITKSDLDSLTRFQLQLVNDKSHIILNQNQKLTVKDVKDKLKRFFSFVTRKHSYSPDSSFFILWKGILIITYLLTIFDVPLQFLNQYSETGSTVQLITFFYIPILVFIIEIILNFNTGFYREGQIVEEKQQIFENYVEFQFWLDTVTVCGFAISQIFPYAKVLFLIRIYNLFLQIRQFEDRAQFTQRFPSFWTLLKLFTLIFCVAHFCGCGFSIIAYLERANDSHTFTWHVKYNIVDEDWRTHYIYSLYFSFITMITVGYGDIVPQTNIERVYVIFMTLISAAVFGYSVNTIGAIFQDIASKSINYRILKRDIGYFMRSRNIDSQLQVKVFQFLSYYHLEAAQEHQQTEEILGKLSTDLRLQIKKDYFGKALSSSYFLTSNFSPQFIVELTFKAKESFYRKGDHVFNRNEIDQRLLIITKGVCELTFSHPILYDISLLKIDKGDVGSKGFITGQPREVTLRTLSHCTFAYITIEDFLGTIKQFPADYEKFCMLKDQMIFSESENQQKLHCFSCQKFGHGIMNCPFIHLKKSKEIIIQKHLFSPQQQRENHKRGRLKWKNILDLDIIKHDLKSYRIDVISGVKKDDEDAYEDYILKKDKEFFLTAECFSYNHETKAYTIDPKEPYLYPNDDDDEEEDELDELEEEDEEDSSDSQSDFQGSIVIVDDKNSTKQSEPTIDKKLSRKPTNNGKRTEYQHQKKVSYNADSFSNLPYFDHLTPTSPKENNLKEQILFKKKSDGNGTGGPERLGQKKSSLIKVQINQNEPIFLKTSQTLLDKIETKKLKPQPLRQITSIFQQPDNNKQFGYNKSKTSIQYGNFKEENNTNNNNVINNANNNTNNNNPQNEISSPVHYKRESLKHNTQNNNNQSSILNQYTFNANKYKHTFEQAPILKIQDIPQVTHQHFEMHYQQQQQKVSHMNHRKSIMVVSPNGIFQVEPNLQSLNLSQPDNMMSRVFDYRKSGYQNNFEPLIQYLSQTDALNMHDMMYQIDFDVAREFLIYFPNGNYTTIIKSIKSKQRIKQIQTLKTNKIHTINRLKMSQTQTNIN